MNTATTKKPLQGLGLLIILAIAITASAGCQRMEKMGKHWESGMEGLNRTITAYDLEGDVLGRWNAKTYIETSRHGVVAFLDSAGHETKIIGGVVIVQEH